jgi:hypothetical protein
MAIALHAHMSRVRVEGESELPDFAVRTSSTVLPIYQLDPTIVDHQLSVAFLPSVMLSETMEHDIAVLERSGVDLSAPPPVPPASEARGDGIAHVIATLILVVVAGVSAFFITSAIAADSTEPPVIER